VCVISNYPIWLLLYGQNIILKTSLCIAIPEQLHTSGNTIPNWIIERYEQGLLEIVAHVQENYLSSVHQV